MRAQERPLNDVDVHDQVVHRSEEFLVGFGIRGGRRWQLRDAEVRDGAHERRPVELGQQARRELRGKFRCLLGDATLGYLDLSIMRESSGWGFEGKVSVMVMGAPRCERRARELTRSG